MFEAVGLEQYDEFFGACDRLLKADGAMVMQTITMNEHRFAAYHRSSDWIQRRIFLGSELASIREIVKSLVRCTRMSLHGMEASACTTRSPWPSGGDALGSGTANRAATGIRRGFRAHVGLPPVLL